MDNGAPESSAGASQPRHFASPDALSNPQPGSAPGSNPFALTLVHRPKLSDSDIGLTGRPGTSNTAPTSPSKRTQAAQTAPPPPSSKHVTAATAAVSVASILSNSHSRYSQQQFDEESTGGDGEYRHEDESDDHDLGFALDVDLEHDYVLARGGGGRNTHKRGHHHSKSFPASRPKHRVPVKTGRAFTRKVQHRRVGSGGRSGSGGGLSLGLGGRAVGGAPLAADGFEDIDPGFDLGLGLGLGGTPLTASSNGIGGRLQRLKENRHRRFASQQRVRRGRGAYHNLHGQHNWSLQHIASLLSGSNGNSDQREPPALHYVTAHSVWTALQALPGFLFDESVEDLFQDESSGVDGHGIVRLLGTILADPAIVCACDKSTCRGRNTGLPQFIVVLFALAPTLHAWRSLAQPPWTVDADQAGLETMHDGINAMMADFGIDDMGDGDMGDIGDTDMSVQTPTAPAHSAHASETDTPFWTWLADAVFGQFPGSNKENSNSGNGNDTNHAPGLVEDRERPAWVTDAYNAPDIGHKLWALVQLFVRARRAFLSETSDMDGSHDVDIENLAETASHLLAEHSQTHPCRWGSPLTCKDPICFQDSGDASRPMQCCPLHDQRIGLAVDVWCLWAEEGRRSLGQASSLPETALTRPTQQTHRALIEWKGQLDQRDRLHQNAVVEQLQRQ